MLKKFLAFVLSTYPILIIVERYIPILGTVLTAFGIFFSLILLCERNKKYILKYLIISGIVIFSCFTTTDLTIHLNHIKHLGLAFLVFDLCVNKDIIYEIKEYGLRYKRIIFFFVIINLIVNMIMLVSNYGYSSTYSESWGIRAFQGIYSDPHQCAYRTCGMLLVCTFLIDIIENKNKKYIFGCSMMFLILILMSGARVPAVLAVVIEILIIKKFKFKLIKKQLSMKQILTVVIAISSILTILSVTSMAILKNTGFWKKMQNSMESSNFDNGRSHLQKVDLEYFNNLDVKNKIFGAGSEKTYLIHMKYFNMKIWAHNDFTQIMIGMGLIVLFLYCFQILKLRKITFDDKILKILFILSVIFVAWKNGLYIHPRFTFSIIFLSLAQIDNSKNQELIKDEKNGK